LQEKKSLISFIIEYVKQRKERIHEHHAVHLD
jgi:hypothetical protein